MQIEGIHPVVGKMLNIHFPLSVEREREKKKGRKEANVLESVGESENCVRDVLQLCLEFDPFGSQLLSSSTCSLMVLGRKIKLCLLNTKM